MGGRLGEALSTRAESWDPPLLPFYRLVWAGLLPGLLQALPPRGVLHGSRDPDLGCADSALFLRQNDLQVCDVRHGLHPQAPALLPLRPAFAQPAGQRLQVPGLPAALCPEAHHAGAPQGNAVAMRSLLVPLHCPLQREAWRPLQGFLQCWRKILAPVGCQHSCLCFPEHSSAPKTQGRPGKEGGCPAHTKAGTCRNPRVQDFGGVIVLHGGG